MSRCIRKYATWTVCAVSYAVVLIAFVGLDQAVTTAQSLAYAAAGLSTLAGMTVFFIATHDSKESE